jgi:hypothetical protein
MPLIINTLPHLFHEYHYEQRKEMGVEEYANDWTE